MMKPIGGQVVLVHNPPMFCETQRFITSKESVIGVSFGSQNKQRWFREKFPTTSSWRIPGVFYWQWDLKFGTFMRGFVSLVHESCWVTHVCPLRVVHIPAHSPFCIISRWHCDMHGNLR